MQFLDGPPATFAPAKTLAKREAARVTRSRKMRGERSNAAVPGSKRIAFSYHQACVPHHVSGEVKTAKSERLTHRHSSWQEHFEENQPGAAREGDVRLLHII